MSRDAADTVITHMLFLPCSLRRVELSEALGKKLPGSLPSYDSGFQSVLPGWLGALDCLQKICQRLFKERKKEKQAL